MKGQLPKLNPDPITVDSIKHDQITVALTLRLAGLSSDQTTRLWIIRRAK